MEESILKRINQPGSPHLLAFFRITIGLYTIYLTRSPRWEYLNIMNVNKVSKMKTMFPSFLEEVILNNALYIVDITFYLAILFTIGIFTRITSILFFISYMMMMGFHSMNGAVTHWPYFWCILLILVFSSCSDRLSLDRLFKIGGTYKVKNLQNYQWPIELATLWIVVLYLSAGLAKILPFQNGYFWLDGGTIQNLLYTRFLYSPMYYIFGVPLFDYSIGNNIILIIISVCTILLELGVVVLLFTRKFHLIIFFSLFLMHFIIYMIGVGDFTIPATVLCICLVNPAFVNKQFMIQN